MVLHPALPCFVLVCCFASTSYKPLSLLLLLFFFFNSFFLGGRSVKNYYKWRYIPVVGKILYAGICGRKKNRCGLQRGPVFMGRSIYSTTLSTKWGEDTHYILIKKSLSCTVIIICISRSIKRYRFSRSKCTDVDFSVVHYWNALLCVMCFYWRQPLHLV